MVWIISSLEIVQFCQEFSQSRPVPLEMACLSLCGNTFSSVISLKVFYELSHDIAKGFLIALPQVVILFGMF